MSATYLLKLIREVEAFSDPAGIHGSRRPGLEERCFRVISQHSGRRAVAFIGRNTRPQEAVTPELELLIKLLCPEGYPGDRLFIDGIELVRVLAARLEELIRVQQDTCRRPRVSRGWRVEQIIMG